MITFPSAMYMRAVWCAIERFRSRLVPVAQHSRRAEVVQRAGS
jgi:hypothetical protein